jgi:hypothetical protein
MGKHLCLVLVDKEQPPHTTRPFDPAARGCRLRRDGNHNVLRENTLAGHIGHQTTTWLRHQPGTDTCGRCLMVEGSGSDSDSRTGSGLTCNRTAIVDGNLEVAAHLSMPRIHRVPTMRKFNLVIALCLLAATSWSQEMTAEEIDYKANFIVQLAQNVEWPEGMGKDTTGAVVIGVVGQSSLTSKLKALAGDSARKGPGLTIKEYKIEDNLATCHILFISTKEPAELAKIFKKIEGRSVLTVSDAEYFARYGVMINFYTEPEDSSHKVRFQVNRRTTKEAGIQLSTDLLKRATLI